MNGAGFAAELDYVALAGGYGSVGPLSVCPRPGDASITMATPLAQKLRRLQRARNQLAGSAM